MQCPNTGVSSISFKPLVLSHPHILIQSSLHGFSCQSRLDPAEPRDDKASASSTWKAGTFSFITCVTRNHHTIQHQSQVKLHIIVNSGLTLISYDHSSKNDLLWIHQTPKAVSFLFFKYGTFSQGNCRRVNVFNAEKRGIRPKSTFLYVDIPVG